MGNKKISTFEKEMKNPDFRKEFDKEYADFLLNELTTPPHKKRQLTIEKTSSVFLVANKSSL